MLATDTQAPVVTETAVGADLLEALEVLTKLAVQAVGDNLRVLAVGDVALSVQEPGGDLVLGRGLEDGDDALELFGGELTSTVLEKILSAFRPFIIVLARTLQCLGVFDFFPPPLANLHTKLLLCHPHPSRSSNRPHALRTFRSRLKTLQELPGCWIVSNVPLAEVDIGLLADQVGVTATDTLDLGQSVHDLLLAINVGVEQTQNELEVRLLAGHERCNRKKSTN